MTVPSTPADRHDVRFKQPVEAPLSALLIASLAVIAAACQLFAWALARLPMFFMWFGLLLMIIGLGIGAATLVQQQRLRWVVYIGPQAFTVLRGRRRAAFSWERISDVRIDESSLRILGSDEGRPLSTLPIDRTAAGLGAAQTVRQAARQHLRTSS